MSAWYSLTVRLPFVSCRNPFFNASALLLHDAVVFSPKNPAGQRSPVQSSLFINTPYNATILNPLFPYLSFHAVHHNDKFAKSFTMLSSSMSVPGSFTFTTTSSASQFVKVFSTEFTDLCFFYPELKPICE